MHKIVKSTEYPVGDGRAGTPIWDKIKCSKLEDFPTNPSQHPCPSPPMVVICQWSHPVESRSITVYFCHLPFLCLQLKLLKVQRSLSPSHTTYAQPPSSVTLCRLTRRIFPHTTTIPYECTLESHHLKDTLASQVPQKLVSQMCEILPPAPSTPLSHPPALQVGSSCLLLYFYTEGSEPSNSDVYLEVKDERLVLCLWSH